MFHKRDCGEVRENWRAAGRVWVFLPWLGTVGCGNVLGSFKKKILRKDFWDE